MSVYPPAGSTLTSVPSGGLTISWDPYPSSVQAIYLTVVDANTGLTLFTSGTLSPTATSQSGVPISANSHVIKATLSTTVWGITGSVYNNGVFVRYIYGNVSGTPYIWYFTAPSSGGGGGGGGGTPPSTPPPPVITSPAAGSILGTSQAFYWNAPSAGVVTSYTVTVSSGSTQYQNITLAAAPANADNLPQDGSSVTLSVTANFNDGTHSTATASYTSFRYVGSIAFTAPAPNGTLSGSTVTFTWTPTTSASSYVFSLADASGTSPQTYAANVAVYGTSYTVANLPVDGRTLSAKVSAVVPGVPQPPSTNTTFTAYTASVSILTPAQGSTLTGPTATFTWNAVTGVSSYQLDRGTAANPTLYGSTQGITGTSATVGSLPTDGSTIAVTLTANIPGSGAAVSRVSYVAAGASTQPPGPAVPLSPAAATSTSITPILAWAAPTTNYIPNSTTFTVKLTDVTTSTALPDIAAGTALTVQVGLTEGLVINHTYSWGVVAANGANVSAQVTTTFATVPSSVTTAADFGVGSDAGSGASARPVAAEVGIGLDQASIAIAVVVVTGLRGAYPNRFGGRTPGDLYSH